MGGALGMEVMDPQGQQRAASGSQSSGQGFLTGTSRDTTEDI